MNVDRRMAWTVVISSGVGGLVVTLMSIAGVLPRIPVWPVVLLLVVTTLLPRLYLMAAGWEDANASRHSEPDKENRK
jgi:hypothetical protein